MTGSDSHEPNDEPWTEDGEAELIVCPQCAHPNLIFRTHCRKCGGRLVGTANLIPGADLIEWSPTDGPPSHRPAIAPLRVLVMLAGIIGVVFVGYAVQTRSPAGLLLGLVPLVAAFVIYTRIRDLEAEQADEDDAPPADSPACPECGAPVYDYDDICSSCGALTGDRIEDAPPGV